MEKSLQLKLLKATERAQENYSTQRSKLKIRTNLNGPMCYGVLLSKGKITKAKNSTPLTILLGVMNGLPFCIKDNQGRLALELPLFIPESNTETKKRYKASEDQKIKLYEFEIVSMFTFNETQNCNAGDVVLIRDIVPKLVVSKESNEGVVFLNAGLIEKAGYVPVSKLLDSLSQSYVVTSTLHREEKKYTEADNSTKYGEMYIILLDYLSKAQENKAGYIINLLPDYDINDKNWVYVDKSNVENKKMTLKLTVVQINKNA